MIGFGQSDGALRVRRGAREKKREKKSRPTDASLRKPRNAQRGADPARAFSRAFRVCSDPRTAMSRAASALERAGESSCGVSHRGRGSRPEVASPPGPIARDSVALAGGKMENRTRGTSFPWRSVGGKHTSGTSGGKSAERRRRVTYRLACRLCRSCPRRVGPRGDCGRAGARTRACLCARERVEERGQRRVRRGSVGGWRKRSPRDVPGRRGRGRAGTAPPAGHGGREVAGIICPVTGHVCRVCRTVASVGALRAWKCRGGTGRGEHGRSAGKRDWPIFPGQKGRAARSKSMNRGKQV